MNNKENSLSSVTPIPPTNSKKPTTLAPITLGIKSPLQTLLYKNAQYVSPSSQSEESDEPSSPLDDYLMSRKRKWTYPAEQEWTFNLAPVDMQ